jgi:glutamyl-tRNA(Gln) amidotransferase subunit E
MNIIDVTELFASSVSKVVRKAVDSGGRVKAVLLPGYGGLLKAELQPGRRFGTELSDRAKVYGGVGGIFHTDELPAYGITEEEVRALKEKAGCGESDCVVFVATDASLGEIALGAVVERAIQATKGVPAEVRAANEDGTTRFMRPMPGSARMYPETDVPAIVVDKSLLESVEKELPELLDTKADRYVKEYGLSRDLACLVVDSPYAATFEDLVKADGLNPSFVASTFEYTFKMLRREGVDIESFNSGQTREVLLKAHRGEVAKEAIPDIFRWLASNSGRSVDDAAGALSLGTVDRSALRTAVAELVQKNLDLVKEEGDRALGPLMGDMMKKFRGKVDGKVLHEMLREEIKKRREAQPP